MEDFLDGFKLAGRKVFLSMLPLYHRFLGDIEPAQL